MLKEAKALYDLGFAIHWIKKNDKAPLNEGWTSGVRESWEALAKDYRSGLNVGVQLGKASKFPDGTFLCVVDCDMKSTDPRHLREMRDKLKELGIGPTWIAESGRRMGSRHYFVRVTDAQRTKRFGQSKDEVKLHMPSLRKHSPYELKNLTAEEIKGDIHIRPAWEISVMGQGGQVVLPPSVHCDTKKRYRWLTGERINDWGKIAEWVQPEPAEGLSKQLERASGAHDLKPVAVDPCSLRTADHIADMVISGKGVTDRSASLFLVAIAMLKQGYSDEEICSLLTDRHTFLGEAAYEHAKTDDRLRAMRWIEKYTLAKAKFETDARRDFEDEIAGVTTLDSATAVEAQAAEITDMHPWREQIERVDGEAEGKPKSTLRNVVLIMKGACGGDLFRLNEFSGQETYGVVPPWHRVLGSEVREIDLSNIRRWFAEFWRFEPAIPLVHEAIRLVAFDNRFHPVRNFLEKLEWDGKPRIDHWLQKYLNADGPEKYVSAIGAKTLVAMIKRIYEPGCKFDQVLILEGLQGCGKSTAVRTLSEPWFSDGFINIGDKDGVLAMRSVWVVELGELSGMRKADVDQLKEFISRQSDRIRTPYGRLVENFPRQCIFIGTTNSDSYLKDPTGNRRFWPVKVGATDFRALEKDRNQLIAEAKVAYELGEKIYLDDDEVRELATSEQEKRVFEDEWVGKVKKIIYQDRDGITEKLDPQKFTIDDILARLGITRDTKADQMRASDALKSAGFEPYRAYKEGIQARYWREKF